MVAFHAIFANPVYADWQYTSWGEKSEQVLAASKGSLHRVRGAAIETAETIAANPPQVLPVGAVLRAKGAYRAGDLEFTALLYFDSRSDKLEAVMLVLKSGAVKLDKMVAALVAKYGSPYSDQTYRYGTRDRKWIGGGDMIQLDDIRAFGDTIASLTYHPISKENQNGL